MFSCVCVFSPEAVVLDNSSFLPLFCLFLCSWCSLLFAASPLRAHLPVRSHAFCCQVYSLLSECLERQERWARAAVARLRHMELAKEVGSKEEQAHAFQGMGSVFTHQGRYR